MVVEPVAITAINLFLCIVILVLGVRGYARKKGEILLYVGIAFGLFGVSHAITLLGLAEKLVPFIIAIRLIAYLLIIYHLRFML